MRRLSRSWSWALLAVVVVGALAVGTFDGEGELTRVEEIRAVAETVKCPKCPSQSVANSDAPAAEAMRVEIERRLDAGDSPNQIRSYLAGQYGEEVLLTPTSSGISGLVWVLPVAGLVVVGAGLTAAFRRWRAAEPVTATDADRHRVAAAQRSRHEDGET